MRPKRCLWIVNHKTLFPIELSLLGSFGFEVYAPKIIPNDPGYRSAVVDYGSDRDLSLDRYVLDLLNRHHFYEEKWSATFTDILNENFDLLISSFSGYTTPLFEAIRKFDGQIVARVFGRENPARYSDFFPLVTDGDELLDRIKRRKAKFWFGQAFDNLYEIEHDAIQANSVLMPVGLPPSFFNFENTWTGKDPSALILCPNIMDSPYYKKVYDTIVRDFHDLPWRIFGRQNVRPNDPRVSPYMSDDDLFSLYQNHRLFLYPSEEPRHLHYSPLEAIIIGQPVLYRAGGLLERLAKKALPGQCADNAEMREKAKRLINGDAVLVREILESQKVILESLSDESVRGSWQRALETMGLYRAPLSRAGDGQLATAGST